jgi:FKBP-type peptidyl-prolyl cis-trans isomerase FkpA
VVVRDLTVGVGAPVRADGTLTVRFEARSSSGDVIDASRATDPRTLRFERLIPCWREGLEGMRVGGRRTLACPPELAGGDGGSRAEAIGFAVELVAVGEPVPPPGH